MIGSDGKKTNIQVHSLLDCKIQYTKLYFISQIKVMELCFTIMHIAQF